MTPEVKRRRKLEQIERRRILNRRLVKEFERRHPYRFHIERRRIEAELVAERGPIPGDHDG